MKTITSANSLIHFNQNSNGSNISGQDGEAVDWLLKPVYCSFFKAVSDKIKEMRYSSFIKLWDSCCNNAKTDVEAALKRFAARHNFTLDVKKQIIPVQSKFLGNCEEILAELYFTSGKFPIVNPNVYIPVDPHHEHYSDAISAHVNTGLVIDIQIKNFIHSMVEREVFVKTSDTADSKIRGPNAIYKNPEEIMKYISTPHQIIFSTFIAKSQLLLDEYIGRVIFIGPKEIDQAGFQGDSRKSIPGSYSYFDRISEEIAAI